MHNDVRLPGQRRGTFAAAAFAALLSACGGDGTPPGSSVSGVASKGPLDGAQVCAFEIAGAAKGAPIGRCVTTDAGGHYTLDLGAYSGDVLLEASGGHYVDEATGATVALAAPLRVALTGVAGGSSTSAAITPLTELAVQQAAAQAGGLSSANLAAALATVQTRFGVADIVGTPPVDALSPPADASAAQKAYALALAAVSQLLAGKPAGTGLGDVLASIQGCLQSDSACGTLGSDLEAAAGRFKSAHGGFDDVALTLASLGGSAGAAAGGGTGTTAGTGTSGGTGTTAGTGTSGGSGASAGTGNGTTTGGGTTTGNSGVAAVSGASGDLSTQLVARTFPAALVDVTGASPDVLLVVKDKAYAYAWNFVTHSNYYFKLSTSSDGVHWSDGVKVSGIDNAYKIAVNASGKLMAFGCNISASGNTYVNTPSLKTSADGIAWTDVALPALTGEFCTNGGGQIYALGDAFAVVDQRCATLGSADGINWTEGKLSTNGSGVGGQYACGSGHINGGTLIIEHGLEFGGPKDPSPLAFSTTTDAITWTKHTSVLTPQPNSVTPMAFLPDGSVQVGDQVAGTEASLWTSTDLVTWAAGTATVPVFKYSGFYVVAPATGGANQIATSPGYQYACAGTLRSATDGMTFSVAAPFAAGGSLAGDSCKRAVYLAAAKRLVVVAVDQTYTHTVLLSND